MGGDGNSALMARDAVVLLGAALLFVLAFRRFGLGSVLGYLVAGAIIGPHMLGLVGDPRSKLGIAELGISLLLFLVGLELTPSRLWRLKQDVFGFGLIQVILCGIALAGFVYLATSISPAAALALGLPLALSSTAQVLPMLQSAGRLRTPFGERAFSILLFQDLSLVPLITIVAALSRAPAEAGAAPGWLMAVYTVLAIVGLVMAGRYLFTPLFKLIGGMGERELFVAAGLFTVLASSAVMEALGLSTALGAFVAGVMLAESPYRHELEADVDPFRSILLGLFFVAVGMMLDLHAIADRPLLVLGLAAGVILIKTSIILLLGRLFGMGWRQAFGLGLLLSQGGEFGFVLFTRAQDAQLIAPEAASLFSAVVTLSMATTPFLMMLSKRFRSAPIERKDMDGPERADQARAIIVGYGRFGQTVGQMLTQQRISVTLIDSNPAQIERNAAFDTKVYFGNASRIDLLRHAGADEAQLILFCHDDNSLDAAALRMIAEAFPKASILVRAYDRLQMMKIGNAPIAGAVREVYESAIRLACLAMRSLEIDEDEIRDAEAEYRKLDAERLALQTETGDLRAGADMIPRPSGPLVEPTA